MFRSYFHPCIFLLATWASTCGTSGRPQTFLVAWGEWATMIGQACCCCRPTTTECDLHSLNYCYINTLAFVSCVGGGGVGGRLGVGGERERERERQTDRQTDRQYRQTDRQTQRQAGSQADRQTDRGRGREEGSLGGPGPSEDKSVNSVL